METLNSANFVTVLALIGAVTIIAALLSGLIERSGLPQVAIFLGLGAILGPTGLNLFDVRLNSNILQIVATLSLVLVLFTDAVSLKVSEIRKRLSLAFLVLGPGTLLSALLMALLGWTLLGLSLPAAAILGAALASTDPVLLRGAIKGERLPAAVRQALRLESGLNDAVLLPVVLIGMTFLADGSLGPADWGHLGLSLFLLGPGVGAAIGFLAVSALVMMRRRLGVRRDYESLYSIGVVFTAYAGAEAVHGSGFLAAFAAGMAIAALDVELCDCFLEYGETTAEMALLFTFILFGASLIWSGLLIITPRTLAFAALVILVRPVAFLLSLAGARLAWKERFLIAWLGPRGLSSLLLILLPVFAGVKGSEALFSITCLVVLLSIVLHGGTLMWIGRNASAGALPPPAPALPRFGISHGEAAVETPNETLISVEATRRLQEVGAPLFLLDARSEKDYAGSDELIEGAIRLSPDRSAEQQATTLGLPKNAWLVIFCACPHDEMSLKVGEELRRAGWPRARALERGWEALKEAGFPVVQRQ